MKIIYIALLITLSSCISIKSIRNNYSDVSINNQEIFIDATNLPEIKYDGPAMNAKTFEKLNFGEVIGTVKTELNKLGAKINTKQKETDSHTAEITSLKAIVTFNSIKVNVKMKILRLSDNYEYKASGTYYKQMMGDEKKMFEKALTQALMEFYELENKK